MIHRTEERLALIHEIAQELRTAPDPQARMRDLVAGLAQIGTYSYCEVVVPGTMDFVFKRAGGELDRHRVEDANTADFVQDIMLVELLTAAAMLKLAPQGVA